MSFEAINPIANALQLSILSPINSITQSGPNQFTIEFDSIFKGDLNLKKFEKMASGLISKPSQNSIAINTEDSTAIATLTEILLLTRLEDQALTHLLKKEPLYKKWIEPALSQSKTADVITTIEAVGEHLKEALKVEDISQSELSEKTGLTPATLSRFLNGGDTRLSSLLKILESLDYELKIVKAKPKE